MLAASQISCTALCFLACNKSALMYALVLQFVRGIQCGIKAYIITTFK